MEGVKQSRGQENHRRLILCFYTKATCSWFLWEIQHRLFTNNTRHVLVKGSHSNALRAVSTLCTKAAGKIGGRGMGCTSTLGS